MVSNMEPRPLGLRLLPVLAFSLSLAGIGVSAAEDNQQLRLEKPEAPSLNRFGANFSMGFNIDVRFKNLGGFQRPAAVNDPAANPPRVGYVYDDGYVLGDNNSHQSLGYTWNWGFQSPNQVVSPDGPYQSLLQHRASALNDGSSKADGDPGLGFELTYNRQLGKLGRGRWGLFGAFGYLNVDVTDGQNVPTTLAQTTDYYALDGLVPYNPTTSRNPYQGTYAGPGTLINKEPVSSSTVPVPNGATVAGRRDFEADLYGFRVGPYLEFPLGKRLAVGLSGGVAFAYVDSRFSYTETVTIPGIATSTEASGSGTHNDWLVGGFVEANLSYALSRSLDLSLAARYQYLGTYSQTVDNRVAELDLSKSIFLTVGVGYSF
jgi:hypothetical protein